MILSILSVFHIESLDLFEPSGISLNSAEGFKGSGVPSQIWTQDLWKRTPMLMFKTHWL